MFYDSPYILFYYIFVEVLTFLQMCSNIISSKIAIKDKEEIIMDRSKKLSETEYEIMEILWKSKTPMSAAQLLSYFAEHYNKEWKASTLATFLSRLAQKGVVTSRREGRVPYYSPIKSREEYERDGAQGILDTLYDGSIKNFFAALYGGTTMSKEDRDSLKEWLDNQ